MTFLFWCECLLDTINQLSCFSFEFCQWFTLNLFAESTERVLIIFFFCCVKFSKLPQIAIGKVYWMFLNIFTSSLNDFQFPKLWLWLFSGVWGLLFGYHQQPLSLQGRGISHGGDQWSSNREPGVIQWSSLPGLGIGRGVISDHYCQNNIGIRGSRAVWFVTTII